jgi:hypothetical protein
MLFASCNKDLSQPAAPAAETSNEPAFPVTFQLNDFSQELDSFGRRANVMAFSTHFEMVVNGSANAKVSLDRIVARLQFIIQDPLPADAGWLDIQFTGIPRVFNFPTGQVSNEDNGNAYSNYGGYRFQIPTYNQGKPGFKTQAYFPLQGSYTVPAITVTGSNHYGEVLVKKVINNVKFEVNKRTVLKGNLFPTGNGGVEVDLNDTKWKPDSIAVFF